MSTPGTTASITDAVADAVTDPQMRAFITHVEALEAAPDAEIAAVRAAYEAMAATFRAPRPAGVAVADGALAGVAVRRYAPKGAAARAVYYHGGGFMVGSLDSHDDVCAEIAAAGGVALTAVDYRLAPEHPFPAAFDDALAVARALLAEGPLVLVGDSAGGTLAASVAWALRGEAIRGQVLIYPALGGHALGLASYVEQARAPLLTTADVAAYARAYAGEDPPRDDPRMAVLAAQDLAGIAPCFASAAAVDPLRDDAAEYVRRLSEAGIEARGVVEAGLPHMWLRARHLSPAAGAAFARVVAAVEGFAAG